MPTLKKSGGGGGESRGGGSAPAVPPPARPMGARPNVARDDSDDDEGPVTKPNLGGLFAGGIPTLKKAGSSTTGQSCLLPISLLYARSRSMLTRFPPLVRPSSDI
jgi:hypothetical protein